MDQSGFPVSFDKRIISCSKSVSSTHTVDQMKNKPKLDVLFQPPRFETHLLMVFPVEKLLTDNLKTYSLMDPVKFLEIQGMTHVILYKYIN